jgi:formylglycine-generating enzyme required for sulfatase activity
MKRMVNVWGIIIMVMIIGLSVTACPTEVDDGSDEFSHIHVFGSYKSSETEHWQECDCGEEKNRAAHVNGAWLTNVFDHWKECSVCKVKSALDDHTGNPTCTTCSLDNTFDFENAMVLISAHSFTMGSPLSGVGAGSPKTQHTVNLTKDFYIGKYEVTQEQYEAVMGNFGYFIDGENLPAANITWYQAVAFCNALSEKEGFTKAYDIDGTNASLVSNADGYRLPTEAEWETACKDTRGTPYDFGSSPIEDAAWYEDNSDDTIHEVGQKNPNSRGLHDMHGNVAEWCWDWFAEYELTAQNDPVGPASGTQRVHRGGCFYNSSAIDEINIWLRGKMSPDSRFREFGFRVVRTKI